MVTRYDYVFVQSIRNELDKAIALIYEKNRELEVLTQERDNALLRIEELEAQLGGTPTDWNRYGGGVNPNA